MTKAEITIRQAKIEDIPVILSFILQKAEFDGCAAAVEATAEKLKQTLFGERAIAKVLFAEVEGIAVGFAVFFQTYSSFLAKPSIWLDDLFVLPQLRNKGVGTALLTHLAQIAKEGDCGRIEWTVSVANDRGIAFYKKHGVQIRENTRLCRVDRQTIAQLADRK